MAVLLYLIVRASSMLLLMIVWN